MGIASTPWIAVADDWESGPPRTGPFGPDDPRAAAAMKRFAPLLALLLASGCRMCANSCDYSPTVPGGPPLGLARAGSNLSGGSYATEASSQTVEAVTTPALETAPVEAPAQEVQPAQ